jgi:hypothetical protein
MGRDLEGVSPSYGWCAGKPREGVRIPGERVPRLVET